MQNNALPDRNRQIFLPTSRFLLADAPAEPILDRQSGRWVEVTTLDQGGLPVPELLDQLREDHVTISELLDDLWSESVRLTSQGVGNTSRIATALDYLLTFPTTSHHPAEDLIHHRLRVRAPAAADAIGLLEVEHIELNRMLERAKTAFVCLGPFAGPRARLRFADDARAYVRQAREHLRREETLLFPAAERALRAEDWREIERAMAPMPFEIAAAGSEAGFHVAAE